MSSLQRKALKNNLPPLPNRMATGTHSRFSGLVPRRNQRDYSVTFWDKYFDQKEDVLLGENKFRIYVTGNSGPLLLLLHGGGHSALSWAVFAKVISSMCTCVVAAIDFRGHGDTVTSDDYNMSADILARDIVGVCTTYFKDLPPTVLLGHSMGGAIAVHIAAQKYLPTLSGLAVIDVVEGTALDALSNMQNFLRSRPQQFRSIEHAIEWSIRSGQLKNVESAKVSMSGQLKRVSKNIQNPVPESTCTSGLSNISEDGQKTKPAEGEVLHLKEKGFAYAWRVDLSKTEPHWRGWFQNMSSLFLSSPVPKLLLLAGVDRLDKELTIGQMQGKFQMQILGGCGHMVHEDIPDKVAEIITGFLIRQKLTEAKSSFQRHMPAC